MIVDSEAMPVVAVLAWQQFQRIFAVRAGFVGGGRMC